MNKLITLLLLIIQITIFSQENWNLSQCVDFAVENNIALNQTYNLVASQKINYMESKANILPDLNMGSDVNLNFGRNIDGNTNAVTFDQTLGNNYWVQSSINLFHGLVNYNSMAFNRFLLSAQEQNAILKRNQLIFNVLSAYYTALYSKGLAQVAEKQVKLSHLQFNRMQKLVDVGKESPITVQELKSQWANDKLSLTQATNNANSTMLDLKQLLRLDASKFFNIDSIPLNSLVIKPIPNVDSLFTEAVAILPEIKQQEYLLNASEKSLAISKGQISPQLYASLGYYTDYFDANREDQVTDKFGNQLKNNQSQRIRLGLSIPVFNGASTYSNIKRKQIAILDQQMQLEKRKDDLYAEIWKSINDLQAAQNEYESSVELLDFSKLNLDNISKKLEKGLASATDYEASKQRFVSAEASLLKAKLIYTMRKQMLEFYKNGNWDHL